MPLLDWRLEYAMKIPRADEERQLPFAAGVRLHQALATGRRGLMLDAPLDDASANGARVLTPGNLHFHQPWLVRHLGISDRQEREHRLKTRTEPARPAEWAC